MIATALGGKVLPFLPPITQLGKKPPSSDE
jgi:hypothetical protein